MWKIVYRKSNSFFLFCFHSFLFIVRMLFDEKFKFSIITNTKKKMVPFVLNEKRKKKKEKVFFRVYFWAFLLYNNINIISCPYENAKIYSFSKYYYNSCVLKADIYVEFIENDMLRLASGMKIRANTPEI